MSARYLLIWKLQSTKLCHSRHRVLPTGAYLGKPCCACRDCVTLHKGARRDWHAWRPATIKHLPLHLVPEWAAAPTKRHHHGLCSRQYQHSISTCHSHESGRPSAGLSRAAVQHACSGAPPIRQQLHLLRQIHSVVGCRLGRGNRVDLSGRSRY